MIQPADPGGRSLDVLVQTSAKALTWPNCYAALPSLASGRAPEHPEPDQEQEKEDHQD